MENKIENLNSASKQIRKTIFRMIFKAGGGHIAPAYSIVEILTALYFGNVMRFDPAQPDLPQRDRFILSKGHAGAALYAVLAKANFFNEKILDTYCRPGSILGGHPDMNKVPGVEASTGALGHGFPYAVGIALAGKKDKADYRVFALLGDGECQEGSVWEAALFASHQKLSNLTVIVDYNKLQAMDRLEKIIAMEPFAEKWKAFGWNVREVNGHDFGELLTAFDYSGNNQDKPLVIIAHTVKGKGLSFMENIPIWHYRLPNDEEMKVVMKELDITAEELA